MNGIDEALRAAYAPMAREYSSEAARQVRRDTQHREDVVDLCILALYHATHDGVSPKDRARVLELVTRLSNRPLP